MRKSSSRPCPMPRRQRGTSARLPGPRRFRLACHRWTNQGSGREPCRGLRVVTDQEMRSCRWLALNCQRQHAEKDGIGGTASGRREDLARYEPLPFSSESTSSRFTVEKAFSVAFWSLKTASRCRTNAPNHTESASIVKAKDRSGSKISALFQ